MRKELFRSVLREALERAGAVLRRSFGRVAVRYKGRANLLTVADLESQKAILSLISSRLPAHDYQAEEAATRRTGSDFVWVIDPLDGTTNYAHGYPAFCVSIALLYRRQPLLAGIYDPAREELFTAEAGRGARLNGRFLRVSRTARVDEALLVTGFPYDRAQRSRFYVEFYRRFMVRCHDVRRSGSAALDLAWIAAGRADGFWEFALSPWDVAAGRLLVEEAGGRISDFSGKPWRSLESWGRQTLATNGLLHKEMQAVLNQ